MLYDPIQVEKLENEHEMDLCPEREVGPEEILECEECCVEILPSWEYLEIDGRPVCSEHCAYVAMSWDHNINRRVND